MNPLLVVKNLSVVYPDGTRAIDHVSFSLLPGASVGIIGESGSGKSTLVNSILRMVRHGGVTSGSIIFEGRDILSLPRGRMRNLCGRVISVIPQAAQGALNPVLKVGGQLVELLSLYRGLSRSNARSEAFRLLSAVGLTDARRCFDSYPHQLSGGQRQRALVAMALAGDPKLILADEPTTALDVTVQARIVRLLRRLQQERGFALCFITHQLSLLPGLVDEVLVLRAGRVEEEGPLPVILSSPRSSYTSMLLSKMPILGRV